MSIRFTVRALAATALGIVVGCASEPDCSDAVETAAAAARDRQPLEQWIATVDTACASAAESAWTASLAEECAPLYAFHAAHTGAERPADCAGAGFESAWNLGGMLSDMREEAATIERRLQDESLPPDTRRDLERRQVVIGRDLPQLEALARMDGYLPPAEVPDSEQRDSE